MQIVFDDRSNRLEGMHSTEVCVLARTLTVFNHWHLLSRETLEGAASRLRKPSYYNCCHESQLVAVTVMAA